MAKRREIRNSTAEFLIFQIEGKEQGVEVYYKDKTVWCTQKAMGMLFGCSTDNVGLHLKNIFASGELVKESVTEKISATASDGKNYMTQFYNLDAIISVGYRVNSIRATQKAMAQLFEVGIPAISKHLTHIFDEGELDKEVVVSKMEITTQHGAIEGKVKLVTDSCFTQPMRSDFEQIRKSDHFNQGG